jgi:hypothetical protein
MKITKTEKYRVILSNPWFTLGNIVGGAERIDYPHIFSPIFEFEDGTQVCINDTVYRVKNESYNRVVKALKLQEVHISGDVEIFPSFDSAKKELEQEKERTEVSMKSHTLTNNLTTIRMLSDTKDFEKLSLQDIKNKLNNINRLTTV